VSSVLAVLLLFFVPGGAVSAAVESSVCLECHDGYDATLAESTHRLGTALPEPGGTLGCVSCHQDGKAHVEDPSTENMFNPAVDDPRRVVRVCSGCHNPHIESEDIVSDHLARAGFTCTDCHKVHEPGATGTELCESCHAAMINQFSGTSAHPVIGKELGCIDCHSVGERSPSYQSEGGSVDCVGCHPDYSGPHRYEHEAAWSFTTEGSGCTACHSVHSSVNDRLLRRPGNGLCRQCHGVPPLHRVTHDGLGSKYDCLECHSEIHGSNDNSHLLDPQLGSKISGGPDGCFCHNVYE